MEAEALLHRDKCEFFKLFIKLIICFKLSAETKKNINNLKKKAGEETGVGPPSSTVCPTLHRYRPRPLHN